MTIPATKSKTKDDSLHIRQELEFLDDKFLNLKHQVEGT